MNRLLLRILSLGLSVASLLAEGPSPLKLEDGLALWLPLTRDLADHSGRGLRIEPVGGAVLDAEGVRLRGRRDWLEAPHVALHGRPFSVALWLRDETDEKTVGILEQFDRNRPKSHLHLMLRGNRQPYFGFYGADLFSPVGLPADREWVHLAFQYTGTHQEIWIDGRLMCRREMAPYLGEQGVTAIGKTPRWGNVPAKDFAGHLRDVRIYQRALSELEIGVLAGVRTPPPASSTTTAPGPALSRKANLGRQAFVRQLSEDTTLPFIEIQTNGLVINGRAGQVYLLRRSGDFQRWEPVARLTNLTGRLFHGDTNGFSGPAGFFQVEQVEPGH